MSPQQVREHEAHWLTLEQMTRDLCSGFEPVEHDRSLPAERKASNTLKLIDPEWQS